MRFAILATLSVLVHPLSTAAEVTNVTISQRAEVAGGAAFGAAGWYEKLVGRIEFALDPADAHNARIVDLEHAPRGDDGRVRFSSNLYVLRPTDPAKGNGVLLFEVVNRGIMGLLTTFNRNAVRSDDPSALPDFGDALLMRDGYTLVFLGWEFGLKPPLLSLEAPPAVLPAGSTVAPIDIDIIVNERTPHAFLIDDPVRPPVIYSPAEATSPSAVLTVRDLFWDEPQIVPRERWRFTRDSNGVPQLQLDGGFDPGRWYRIRYRPAGPVVAGVALAAFRDAASAFRYRSDLPVQGRAAYVYGNSQTGRFLRQFLYDGFNADERDRRAFDAVWVHIAGAARRSFDRFPALGHGDMFESTRFPFADTVQTDIDGRREGLLSRYRPEQRPKIFYTNTPVEYWAGGRAAALIHTSMDGAGDLVVPDDVRIYLLAGTQHLVGPFPPPSSLPPGTTGLEARNSLGQELSNPTPQINVMRALLRALRQWVAADIPPPPSRYPRLSDGTLVRIQDVKFPTLPGVADPRRIVGPGRRTGGKVIPLPHLVPQVDADGNDLAGIRDPEVAVPLATTTGWNFRRESVGNPRDIYQTLGSYLPFSKTRAAREANGDPRLSIEERYRGIDDYLQRVGAAAMELIRGRYMLEEDLGERTWPRETPLGVFDERATAAHSRPSVRRPWLLEQSAHVNRG